MTDLSESLKDWAENELGFLPRGSLDWESLCKGRLGEKWLHLIARAKSKPKVDLIRRNLRISRYQSSESSLSEWEKGNEEEEALKECKSLLEKKKALKAEIECYKRKIEERKKNLNTHEKDLVQLNTKCRESRREANEARAASTLIQESFLKECENEISKLEEFRSRIVESKNAILRTENVQKLYATNGNNVETAGQRAINQAVYSTKNLFDQITHFNSSVDTKKPIEALAKAKHSSDILNSLRDLGTKQILSEFTQSILLANNSFAKKVEAIDLKEDALRLQSELERNGSWIDTEKNPEGRVYDVSSLINRFCSLHVETVEEYEQNADRIKEIQSKSRERMESVARDLEQITGMSDWSRQVIVRKIKMDVTLVKWNAILKKINDSASELQQWIKASSQRRMDFSKLKFTLIEKQKQDIEEAQSVIGRLIVENRLFYSKLQNSRTDIVNFINTRFNDEVKKDLLVPYNSLEDLYNEQYKDFSSLPLHAYSYTEISDGHIVNVSRLPIHRLINLKNNPCSKKVEEILTCLNLSPFISVAPTLLDLVANLKIRNFSCDLWLKNNHSKDFRTYPNKIENIIACLKEKNADSKNVKVPLIMNKIKNLEETESTLGEISSEILIWRDEPAQLAVGDEPTLTYKDETLSKWQEKYRVSLLVWQQKQS